MKFTPGIMAVSKVSVPVWVITGAAIDLDFVTQRYYWGGAEKTTSDFATYILNGSTFDANGLTPTGTIDVTVSFSGLGAFETNCTWGISAFNTAAPGANKNAFQLDNGTQADRTFLQQTSTGVWQIYLTSGNVSQVGSNTAASALGVKHAAAASYELNNTLMSANGLTAVSSPDTACTMPVSITQVRVGRNNTVNTNPTMAIGRIVVFQIKKTQAELNALTLMMQIGIPIDLTGQTRFGDATAGSGIAAAFDGVTSQAGTACAQKSITSAQDLYIGTLLASPKRISQVTVYGSNNLGFVSVTPSVTIQVYGKLGSDPANSTDGTLLATLATFTDTTNESAGRVIAVADTGTYDRVWVRITHNDATSRATAVAEIQIWEFV